MEGADLLLQLLSGLMILHVIGFSMHLGGLFGDLSLLAHKHSNFVSAPFAKLVFVILRFESAFAYIFDVLSVKPLLLLFKILLCFVHLLLLWGLGGLSCLGLRMAIFGVTLFLATTASLPAGLLFIVLGCSALFVFFYKFAFDCRFFVSLSAFALALARLLIVSLSFFLIAGSFTFFSFALILFSFDRLLL